MCYLTGYECSCNYCNHQIFDKPQRDELTFFFSFWNEKIGRLFLFTLAVFPNQLISRHHQFTEELIDLLLRFPFLPPLQCVLLAWPVSRRKCSKRVRPGNQRGDYSQMTEQRGLDMVSAVTGAKRGK